MKIATLLPYKENYSPNLSGAVSIHVSNLYKYSIFKKQITIWGNTSSKKYLSTNYRTFLRVRRVIELMVGNGMLSKKINP